MYITINASHFDIQGLFITLIELEKKLKIFFSQITSDELKLYWSVCTRDPSLYPDDSDYIVSVISTKAGKALVAGGEYENISHEVKIITGRCDLVFKYCEPIGWVCIGPHGPYLVEELVSIIHPHLGS